jgi:uncharacterized membrane protein YqgA involved in biofilm formation
MKRIKELIKWNIMSLILCIGIILAFKTPGEPITLLNVLLGVIIGFSGGYSTFKWKSKE